MRLAIIDRKVSRGSWMAMKAEEQVPTVFCLIGSTHPASLQHSHTFGTFVQAYWVRRDSARVQ